MTVNGVPTGAEPGAVALTRLTLTSAEPSRLVVRGALVVALFPPAGSVTCCWSTATDVVVVKLWVEGLVQVTDQDGPTLASTDTASAVFWTVCGFGDEVEQSGGRFNVCVESAFVGPVGPLL